MQMTSRPSGTGKTEKTEKTTDLAKIVAMQCVVFNCSYSLDNITTGTILKGLVSCGACTCFHEFYLLNIELFGWMGQQVMSIQIIIRALKPRMIFDGSNIIVNDCFSAFITMNLGNVVNTIISASGILKRTKPTADPMVLPLPALLDEIIPKVLVMDLELFECIISDLIPAGKKSPDIFDGGVHGTKLTSTKVVQLHEMIVVRHGLMLERPSGGGITFFDNLQKQGLPGLAPDIITKDQVRETNQSLSCLLIDKYPHDFSSTYLSIAFFYLPARRSMRLTTTPCSGGMAS